MNHEHEEWQIEDGYCKACGNSVPEPDDREALARVAEYLRQFDRLRDTGGVIHRVHTDPDVDEGADLTSADLRAIIAAGFRRHPEPIKPSREDVARALYGDDLAQGRSALAWEAIDADEQDWYRSNADAVLALFGPGVAEVKAECPMCHGEKGGKHLPIPRPDGSGTKVKCPNGQIERGDFKRVVGP